MTLPRVQAHVSEGVGLDIPERQSDCSGVRPSWYPFQINVCDEDLPDPDSLEGRQLALPSAPDPPDWM